MRLAQILNGKAHWIFKAEAVPEFAPDIVIKDISANPEIQEGWIYDVVTDTFSAPLVVFVEPVEFQPMMEEMQVQTLLNTEYLVIMSELSNL